MTTAQELSVRDKKELVSKEEQTAPGRHYVTYTDIYEIDERAIRGNGDAEISLYGVRHGPLYAVTHLCPTRSTASGLVRYSMMVCYSDAAQSPENQATADFDRLILASLPKGEGGTVE